MDTDGDQFNLPAPATLRDAAELARLVLGVTVHTTQREAA